VPAAVALFQKLTGSAGVAAAPGPQEQP